MYARTVSAALVAAFFCLGTAALAQKKGRDNTAIAEKLVTAGVPIKEGDLVLLASVGAGFTVGTALLRWAI